MHVHITDSTAHNKGLAAAVAEKFWRESPAEQIYCTTHTALGFDRAMEKVDNTVKTEIGMENLFQAFLIDVEIDSKPSICLNRHAEMDLFAVWSGPEIQALESEQCLQNRPEEQGKTNADVLHKGFQIRISVEGICSYSVSLGRFQRLPCHVPVD